MNPVTSVDEDTKILEPSANTLWPVKISARSCLLTEFRVYGDLEPSQEIAAKMAPSLMKNYGLSILPTIALVENKQFGRQT